MKMREWFDNQNGIGSWDRMHDAIDGKNIFGWSMPEMEVDGVIVAIFPEENREVTVEEVKNQLRKAFLQISNEEGMTDFPENIIPIDINDFCNGK